MPRRLVPELLDSLPPDDPEAVRSRADLRRINVLMGNFRWMEHQVRQHLSSFPDGRIIELGAGDGTLAKRLQARLPPLRYWGLDLAPRPADLPPALHWLQGDLFETLPALPDAPLDGSDLIVANLFLHHLTHEQLRTLGTLLGHGGIACSEPWRHPRNHLLGWALEATGINRVTRHDLHASIDAGFDGPELPDALGLALAGRSIRLQRTWLGAYRLRVG